MNSRFMIGQWGGFDEKKYKRDYRQGFYGIEACLFEKEEDTLRLIHESQLNGFQIGIHFPLRAGRSKLRDALFLAQDDAVRRKAYNTIQEELNYSAKIKPAYILFHYPKPVLLDDRVNWDLWRFTDRSEYVYESEYTMEELRERSEILFQWLSDRSAEYDFVPVLEFDGLNRYIYDTDLLEELLQKYDKIRLCLDTGRLFLQHKLDPYFDAMKVIEKYAIYTHIVHLSNTKVTDQVECHHYPVLPEQHPDEGWAPIEQYLALIRERSRSAKIMFEHRSDLITDEVLDRCYTWVDRLLNG